MKSFLYRHRVRRGFSRVDFTKCDCSLFRSLIMQLKFFLHYFFIFDPLWCSRAINREDRQGGTYTIFEILARYATQTLSIVFTTTEIGNTFRYLLAICSPNWVQIWKGRDRKMVFWRVRHKKCWAKDETLLCQTL